MLLIIDLPDELAQLVYDLLLYAAPLEGEVGLYLVHALLFGGWGFGGAEGGGVFFGGALEGGLGVEVG